MTLILLEVLIKRVQNKQKILVRNVKIYKAVNGKVKTGDEGRSCRG